MENKAHSGQMIVEFLIALGAVSLFLFFWLNNYSPEHMEEFIEIHELKNLLV